VEGRSAGVTRSRRNLVVGAVLAVGFVVGLSLVLLGGEDEEPTGDDGTAQPTDPSDTTTSAPLEPGAPLPLDDLSQPAISELTGLQFPADTRDFLTARLDDDRQLDITFVLPPASVATFISGSGLPEPVADQRVVLHSSPLWKLNPEQGAPISGILDETDGVRRAVELVTEPDGSVRARVVITSPL
jgi:hypothetical protein